MANTLKKSEIVELLEDAQAIQEYQKSEINMLKQQIDTESVYTAMFVGVLCASLIVNVILIIKYTL